MKEDKYRFELVFLDRTTDRVIAREKVEAPTQFSALVYIFKICMKYDPKTTYLVVKTNGCLKRPEFIIRNLRGYGIDVVEPITYPSGEKTRNWSQVETK